MTEERMPSGVRVRPVELRFPPSSRWVRRCRHWAAERARDTGASDATAAVVELLTSEVVTNAVRHGPPDGEVAVRVLVDGESVGVEVDDDDPRDPTIKDVGPTATGGRGVQLVDELATRWGVRRRGHGKCVWFVVDVHDGLALAG